MAWLICVLRLGSNWDFAVIGVHIKPDDALNELTNMTDVYTAVQEEWNDVEVDKIDF